MFGIKHLIFKFKLQNIKYIVWDYDGTLYRDKEAGTYIKKKYLDFLNSKFRIDIDRFDLLTEKYGRWGTVASKILKISEIEFLNLVETNNNFTLPLKPNPKLVANIEQMGGYTNFILTNSSDILTRKGLKQIGFIRKFNMPYYPFVKIFSRDITKALKPNKKTFLNIAKFTGEAAYKHLIVGDSYDFDIKPAKDLGFQAVHVDYFWQEVFPLLKKI